MIQLRAQPASAFPNSVRELQESRPIQYATNAFDRINDISETWRDGSFGHQKISTAASSIRFLNRGCKLLRVIISVLPPSMLAARSLTSISSSRFIMQISKLEPALP